MKIKILRGMKIKTSKSKLIESLELIEPGLISRVLFLFYEFCANCHIKRHNLKTVPANTSFQDNEKSMIFDNNLTSGVRELDVCEEKILKT